MFSAFTEAEARAKPQPAGLFANAPPSTKSVSLSLSGS